MKMYGYTYRGSNSVIFFFFFSMGVNSYRKNLLLSEKGELLKERICSSRSKFFSLRVDSFLERFCYPGKQARSHEVISFAKMVEGYPYILKPKRLGDEWDGVGLGVGTHHRFVGSCVTVDHC